MGVSYRKMRQDPLLPVGAQALLAGAALSAITFASSAIVLLQTRGLLGATVGLFSTLLVAFAVGLWVGAPAVGSADSPLRARWSSAGLTFGLAGGFATLYGTYAVFLAAGVGRVLALLLLVAMPAYMLGMVLPALAAWGERREADEAGPGWGSLGVLVMGLIAGLVLGTLVLGLVVLPRIGAGPVLLGVAAALLLPTLFPEAELVEPDEQVLYAAETPFGAIEVVDIVYPRERQPERRLLLNGEEESGELVRSGAPTLAYVAAAERWLVENTPAGASYLLLGGGAYTLPRRLAEWDPRAEISVVELDPEVTRVAYAYFGVREQHRIATFHGDARAFTERAGPAAYDRIYVDVYTGREALPYSLTTFEAFRSLRRLLRGGGWLAVNAIGVVAGTESLRFWSLVRTVSEAFPTVALYTHLGRDYPDRQNVLIVASGEPAATTPEQAGLFEHWPREAWPALGEAVVYRDLFTPSPPAGSRIAERTARTVGEKAGGA
jgi:hypothetical protein